MYVDQNWQGKFLKNVMSGIHLQMLSKATE